MSIKRLAMAAAIAVTSALTTGTAAAATTPVGPRIEIDGSTLSYVGGDSNSAWRDAYFKREGDNYRIELPRANTSFQYDTVEAPDPCEWTPPQFVFSGSSVTCPAAGIDSIETTTRRSGAHTDVSSASVPVTAHLSAGGTVLTGSGDDRLYGSDQQDALDSGGGSDYLDGAGGSDTLNDGDGEHEVVLGGEGDDFFENWAPSQNAADWVYAPGGPNLYDGGPGDDWFEAYQNRGDLRSGVAITGVDDTTWIVQPKSDSSYPGDRPHDTISSVERMVGSPGDDTFRGIAGFGGSYSYDRWGSLQIEGGIHLAGGGGNDLFVVKPGSQPDIDCDEANGILNKTGQADRVDYSGFTANVTVSLDNRPNDGPSAHRGYIAPDCDQVTGGSGKDKLYGNDASNRLDGGPGKDLLRGGAGNDLLLGGSGNDTLQGQAGGDLLVGGLDNDYYAEGRDGAADMFTDELMMAPFGIEQLGGGNDRFKTRDGIAEQIDCGSNDSYDRVMGDATDTQAADCARTP